MCDWNEEDPHCHLNPVNKFKGCAQRNQNRAIDTRYQAAVVLRSQKLPVGWYRWIVS